MLHALLAGEALGCGSQCVAAVNKILKKWLQVGSLRSDLPAVHDWILVVVVRFVVGQQIFKTCCAA
jgi:hypothetical protein